MSLERQLHAVGWRQEQILNTLRSAMWCLVGATMIIADAVNDNPDSLGPAFVAYGLACAAFGYFELRRRDHRWWPIASTCLDLTVLTASMMWLQGDRLTLGPTTRALTLTGQVMGMMLVLAGNALRMSPRTVGITSGYAMALHLLGRAWSGAGMDPFGVVEVVVLGSEGVLLTLAAARQRQLAEQLFEDMRELLDHRVQVMGRLVAGTAHELNTPLGAVASGIQTLTTGLAQLETKPERAARITGAMRQALPPMSEATTRLREVLRTLETFARVDQSTHQNFDMQEGLRSSSKLMMGQAPNLDIELTLEPLPPVRGDPALVNQVLLNLLQVAATSAGERGLVRVSSRSEDDRVIVRIEDDGPSVSAEAIRGLFEPTFRKDGTRVTMGLGLAVSRSVVQDHGGDLVVESTPPRGNATILTLPVADVGSSSER